MQTLNPEAPSVSVVFLCTLWYCARRRYEFLMSYIEKDKLARGLHTHDTTTTKSQHYNYNIDRLTASVLHASPCLQLSITDGSTAWRFYVKEKAHGHTRPSRL